MTLSPPLPPGLRSRTAHGLTEAAAQGRFMLQVCAECGGSIYPPRDACPHCLSARLPFRDVPAGGAVLAETTIRVSGDAYFRDRVPWRIGTVALDCGPLVVAHLHAEAAAGARVRLSWRLDKGGNAVAVATPEPPATALQDDPQWRALTCDPRGRRVLVTDGRMAAGQAMARAMAAAGAAAVFVGVSDPGAPFAGEAALRATPGAEIVPLEITDDRSVAGLVAAIGSRVDILINTAEHARAGGILDADALATARAAMDVRCFGLLRLAQGFGPAMRASGAVAFVNILSVHALVSWPDYAAYAAAEAACLSASQALRMALRGGGIRVLHVFTGPLETESFRLVPPPKVTPAALAAATLAALMQGLEDVYVGEVAQDLRARLDVQPKAVERELGA